MGRHIWIAHPSLDEKMGSMGHVYIQNYIIFDMPGFCPFTLNENTFHRNISITRINLHHRIDKIILLQTAESIQSFESIYPIVYGALFQLDHNMLLFSY